MFGIGTQELLVIFLVVLLLFGGKRIPEVARSVGSGLRDFRKAIRDVQREINLDELTRTPPPSPRRPDAPQATETRVEVTPATGPDSTAKATESASPAAGAPEPESKGAQGSDASDSQPGGERT